MTSHHPWLAMTSAHRLVLVRHGESDYGARNLFCGWHDSDLTADGVKEARYSGQQLESAGLQFDVAFTSVLKRAVKSLYLIQEELDAHWLPVVRSWRLCERHYGALQDLSKSETAAKYGEPQVKVWRRSYDVRPPPLDPSDDRWSGKMKQFAHLPSGVIPPCESLADTVQRVMVLWHDQIIPPSRQTIACWWSPTAVWSEAWSNIWTTSPTLTLWSSTFPLLFPSSTTLTVTFDL